MGMQAKRPQSLKTGLRESLIANHVEQGYIGTPLAPAK